MNKIKVSEYSSPCGTLVLGAIGDSLCMCDWNHEPRHSKILRRLCKLLDAELEYDECQVIRQAKMELDEYFAGSCRHFGLSLLATGTDFQKSVWRAISEIESGTTVSYKNLAAKIGKNSSIRAVANATGANPLSVFIPCHRIIGSNGAMTGYAGGINAKKYLLNHENYPQGLFLL